MDDFINEQGKIFIELSDYSEKKLQQKIREFQNKVKQYNSTVKDINEQYIITNPYFYHKIVSCLHHYAVEISGGKYKDEKEIWALFTGWDYSVLNS